MSDVVTVLAKCQAMGITLRPGQGGKLRVSPPPEKLPGELVAELKCYKVEILAALTQQRTERPRPSLTPSGEVHIPCSCDPKYWYWSGGQSIAATLVELNAPPEVWARYTEVPYRQVQ